MTTHKHMTDERGTTLIELIIYLAICSGILLGVGGTTLAVLEQREKARSIEIVSHAKESAIRIISDDIRSASGVLTPLLPSEASTTLRLRFADPSRDPTIIEATKGMLYRTVALGPKTELLPNSVYLSNALFTKIGGITGAPSVTFFGLLSTGSTTVGNVYKASTEIEITATLRAPLP